MSDWTVRKASADDQVTIRRLVRSEKLNPMGLHWPNFVVASCGSGIVGAAQVRRHRDGSRELGSIVVLPAFRNRGIAEGLVAALVARETGPIYVVTARSRAHRYRRFGFREIAPSAAPGPIRLNKRLGVLAGGAHSLLHGRRPISLTILERSLPLAGLRHEA